MENGASERNGLATHDAGAEHSPHATQAECATHTARAEDAARDERIGQAECAPHAPHAARAARDERALRYARTLARLVQVPTISYPDRVDADRFRAFHSVLIEEFPYIFIACEAEDFDGSLLLRWPGSNPDAQPVLFMNHMDVVEPNGEWGEHGPFSGDIADGKVWGRGTLDTKGGLFGMLQAANELAKDGFVPACDIYFVSACTEEASGSGADKISRALEARGIRFRFTLDEGGYILHDPLGGADGDFAMVGVGEKSLATLRFTATCAGGHASTPGKDTALVRLGRFMAAADRAAKNGFLFRVQLPDAIAQALKGMAPVMQGPLGFVFARADRLKPLLQLVMPRVSDTAAALTRTTIAFTMAEGSDAYNVLPSSAWVIANVRCSHHQGVDASIAAVAKLARRYGISTEVIERVPDTPISDFRSEAFALLEQALHSEYPNVAAVPYIMTGASDSRFMTRVCDHCLRIVPYFITDEQVATIHSVNENVDIATLPAGVDVYKRLMQLV